MSLPAFHNGASAVVELSTGTHVKSCCNLARTDYLRFSSFDVKLKRASLGMHARVNVLPFHSHNRRKPTTTKNDGIQHKPTTSNQSTKTITAQYYRSFQFTAEVPLHCLGQLR